MTAPSIEIGNKQLIPQCPSRAVAVRECDCLPVQLRWDPSAGPVRVEVKDPRERNDLQLCVEHEPALAAFYRPFTYGHSHVAEPKGN